MALTEPFVDIPALSSFLESIGSHHVDLIYAPQNTLRSGALSLYHYTDLSGLVGIIDADPVALRGSSGPILKGKVGGAGGPPSGLAGIAIPPIAGSSPAPAPRPV